MHPLFIGILKKAPEIIVIAKKLADSVKEGKRTVETAERVALLEKNETRQAELIKEMAKQLSDMTAVMKVWHGRIIFCLAGTIVALVLAVAARVAAYAR
jgi:hypothetical protein